MWGGVWEGREKLKNEVKVRVESHKERWREGRKVKKK